MDSVPQPVPAAQAGEPLLPLAEFADARIAMLEDDCLLDTSGRVVAVLRLAGSEVRLVTAEQEGTWLAALERYLERYEEPVMRLTFSYPQPLDAYLEWLEGRRLARGEQAPAQAQQLSQIAHALVETAQFANARLFGEYWVLAYTPPGLGGRTRGAARQTSAEHRAWMARLLKPDGRARQEVQRRCLLLAAALGQANIGVRRVVGAELVALVESAWGTPFAETPPAGQEEPPAASIEVQRRHVRTPSGYVRSYRVRGVGEILAADTIAQLASQPGRRVLHYWEQVPQHQAKKVLRFNQTIQASTRHLHQRREVADLDALRQEQLTAVARANLSFGEKHLYRWRALIQQWAPTLAELDARCGALELELETQGHLVASCASFQQEQALFSSLPLARCELNGPDRTLDAASLARLAWPGPRDALEPRGVWLGLALPSHQILTLDLLALVQTHATCSEIARCGSYEQPK